MRAVREGQDARSWSGSRRRRRRPPPRTSPRRSSVGRDAPRAKRASPTETSVVSSDGGPHGRRSRHPMLTGPRRSRRRRRSGSRPGLPRLLAAGRRRRRARGMRRGKTARQSAEEEGHWEVARSVARATSDPRGAAPFENTTKAFRSRSRDALIVGRLPCGDEHTLLARVPCQNINMAVAQSGIRAIALAHDAHFPPLTSQCLIRELGCSSGCHFSRTAVGDGRTARTRRGRDDVRMRLAPH